MRDLAGLVAREDHDLTAAAMFFQRALEADPLVLAPLLGEAGDRHRE
jgi:hypothetical protein